MSLFGKAKKNEKSISFSLGLIQISADETYISYRDAQGKNFRVHKEDIESVSLDSAKGLMQSMLKINGKGTLPAEVKLNKDWAEKAQEFIYNEIKNKQSSNIEAFDEIERLSQLKDKGIISLEEFNAKKKHLLGL